MKAYTNLKQAKKLAEILPVDSADMYWINALNRDKRFHSPYPHFRERLRPEVNGKFIPRYELGKRDVPCWSLAALLEVMPKQLGIYTLTFYWCDDSWCCSYIDDGSEIKETSSANNPVDAAVEMIVKLKEKDLL